MTILHPRLSIIVPVLHEPTSIKGFIQSLQKLEKISSCEIIIVDGSPTHDTIDALHGESVHKLRTYTGRGHQMNFGADHATSDILLFLHADTTLPRNAIPLILHALHDPRISAGAFHLAIDTPDPRLHLIATLTTLRSRLTRIPFGDQAIFIRKTVFDSLGGYRDIPLMEDVDLMRKLRSTNHHITFLPTPVLTSPRRWNRDGILLNTLRNWTLRIFYYLGVPPHLLQAWYQ